MADLRRRQSRAGAVVAAVAAPLHLAVGLAVGAGALRTSSEASGAPPVPAAGPAVEAATSAAAPSGQPRPGRPARGAAPEAVVVPALGIEAAVSGITLQQGALTPPADPQQIGWWSEGAAPGAGAGAAVLTGHTVHTGGGAFDDLEELAAGDDVVVRTARGRVTYVVDSVRVLDRDELARESADIFDQSGAARLVLITCEDWDGTAYRSNVVVTARPSA